MAVKAWLVEQEPGLAEEIFLDLDPHTGIRPGERWKQALQQANARCEAVICLLSEHWEALARVRGRVPVRRDAEQGDPVRPAGAGARHQHHLGVAALRPVPRRRPHHRDRASRWRASRWCWTPWVCSGCWTALRALGIGAEHFPWPPPGDPDRAPYRGWAPLEEADAAVFFGRDAQIVRGLDVLRGMRTSGVESLFVILGPSGAGKSSFLRAGLLPRLRRDDRRFLPLPIVRPERAVLTGELRPGPRHPPAAHRPGLARADAGGDQERLPGLRQVERLRGWLEEARQVARARLLDVPAEQPAPTLVLPVDQAEELFNADAGPEAPRFLELLAALVRA